MDSCNLTTPARQRGSVVSSLLGIIVCGIGGGALAGVVVHALGIAGIFGALIAAVVGMVLATAFWTGGVVLLRALSRMR